MAQLLIAQGADVNAVSRDPDLTDELNMAGSDLAAWIRSNK